MEMDNHPHPLPPPKPVLDTGPTKPKALLPISYANGFFKKHHLNHNVAPPPPQPNSPTHHHVYRECLKNHAASLGGHALDGCGEFMPSPDSTPSDPTSFTCAACGCHRNFHRRLPAAHYNPHHHQYRDKPDDDDDDDDDGDDEEAAEDDADRDHDHDSPPSQYYTSAPHMLMALSASHSGGQTVSDPHRQITPGVASAPPYTKPASAAMPRKRFRTKFSKEQKEKMHELSERLGWRLLKKDEGLVEECCREIGVSKGVFKVWMHNNKHNFFRPKPGDTVAAVAGAGGGSNGNGQEMDMDINVHGTNGNAKEGGGGGGGDAHMVNGSSPPST